VTFGYTIFARQKSAFRAPPSIADQYQSGGLEALDDRSPKPDRVWNRIPDDVRERIVRRALDEPALSPRELAVRFTDSEGYFVSEASVYRLLKARDLIASPAFIVMKAEYHPVLWSRYRSDRELLTGSRGPLRSRRQPSACLRPGL